MGEYTIAKQTNNSTETRRNFRKQQHCFGVEEHQTINSQAADERLGKYKTFTQKIKFKKMR
jgi:hypothetical protein